MKGMRTWNRGGERHAGIYWSGGDGGDDFLIARIITSGILAQQDNSYEVEIAEKVDYGLVTTMCLLMDDVHRALSSRANYRRWLLS